MMRRSSQAGGFTMVELMIVVAIVAVLATVASTAFIRHIKSARVVGGRAFLSRIHARQATYFQQIGYYCNASGRPATDGSAIFHPPLKPGEEALNKPWDPTTFAEADAAKGWANLGARPEEERTYMAVYVRASIPDSLDATKDHALAGQALATTNQPAMRIPDQPAPPATKHPWYYVVGHLDLNGSLSSYSNGGCASSGKAVLDTPACTVLWSSSGNSTIMVRNEGE